MVFGGVENERIQLNEASLWSGCPKPSCNPKSLPSLPKVRELIAAKRFIEADALCHDLMGAFTESYMPMGDLRLAFGHGDLRADYLRRLDISEAVAGSSYRVGSVTYSREAFVSAPDGVMVLKLAASAGGRISFTARLDSRLRFETFLDKGQFALRGRCPEHVSPSYYDQDDPIIYKAEADSRAIRFEMRLGIVAEGGSTKVDADGIRVEGADACVLCLAAGGTYRGPAAMPDADLSAVSRSLVSRLSAAMSRPYGELRADHVADYRRYFDRVSLRLGGMDDAKAPAMPTDERIRTLGVKDPGLVELLFQYGRYLMISASRPGTMPMNLQGIWSDCTRPPWSSNYTININAEMNYWPAETCNLGELHLPLLEFLGDLAESGKLTAEKFFGCRGWAANHNTDAWAHSSPVGDFGWGETVWSVWPMGGIWLCAHLWEHWLFGRDASFLRDKAWPIMKGAARFALDWLVEVPAADSRPRLPPHPSISSAPPREGSAVPRAVPRWT